MPRPRVDVVVVVYPELLSTILEETSCFMEFRWSAEARRRRRASVPRPLPDFRIVPRRRLESLIVDDASIIREDRSREDDSILKYLGVFSLFERILGR